MRHRGLALHVLLAGSLSAALGAFGFALPQQPPAKELPQEEEKLFQYAQERMNRGAWMESDRAFKAFLERFPQSRRGEEVHQQLAYLHLWHSRRAAEAREWLARACERYPKSGNYWHWRMQSAQTWSQQSLRERAVEEFRKIAKEAPEASIRTQAIQSAWNVEGKHLYLHVNQTFAAGQEPLVHVQLQKIDKIAFRASHVSWSALLPKLQGPDSANLRGALDKVGPEGRRALKSWTAEYRYEKDREWKQEEVRIPSTEPGVYLLEGEHDGVVMSVTLFVSRLGLVTKTAAGRLLCFVQDRATSRPVEGAEIRVLGEKAITGKTGADGVFVAEGFRNGAVVAIREGDVATTQSWWHDRGAERPLIYITTDRPIYRPNQAVGFRVVHRMEVGEKLEVRAGARFVVEIRDAKGNKVYEKTHALDPFGAAEGGFTLGDEPALGEYTVFVRKEEESPDLHQHDWRWMGFWGPGPHNFMKFRVDEYRKPEYRVDVGFKAKSVLQGEEISATIDARYYFGSPVVGAEVAYTVHRRPQYPYWRCWDFYYDWYQDEEDEEDYGHRGGKFRSRARGWHQGEQVLQGTGRTDKDGKVAVVFSSQKWDHDAVYTVSAKVTDLSRRAVDGSGSCKATRAEFGLAMSLDKYVYKPGDRMSVRVRAATPDDQVVPGAEIAIQAHERRWRKDQHDDTLIFEGTARTGENGVADFGITPDREGGYLVITARARDKRGNEVKTEHWAWLCGSAWAGDTVNLNGIDLLPDKRTYEPGETAQLLVTSQFRNFSLLLTIEGKEIFHHEVVTVKGHAATIPVKLDRAAYAPNVYVSVTAIQSNQVVQRRKMLIVNPASRFVSVEVKADKDQYRPRQKAVYEVVTRGADGAPVSAAVSLGIVDESIYALQDEYAPDIRKHFVYRRGDEVGTSTSLEYHDWGRADEKKQEGVGGKAFGAPAAKAAAEADGLAMNRQQAHGADERRKDKDGAPEYAATEVRSKFADTMIWKTVVTGPDGRARVEVELPDNLTTWRATARAATLDSRFGQSGAETLVRKEMIVRLEAPRFFTQGDATVVSAIVHNYLEAAKDVKIEFEAVGVEVGGELSRIVRVDREGQARIDFTAKVKSAGAARLTVKALSDQDSDAMQLTVPVYPYGAVRYDSRAGIAEGRVVEKVVLPAGAAKDAAELVVVVNPTHASMVLDSLEYLAGYPYGCVEQTMSRFLPTVVVSKALQKLGIEKKELQAELPHMVEAGLQRLMNFQQADGGWGWWQNDASNPWITAYVVTGLAMARDADHKVDPHVLTRGVAALQRHLAQSKEADQQAYLLYALSVAGARHDDVRSRLTDRLSELRPYSKALLALVLKKDGRDAREVLSALAKEAQLVGASAQFEGGTRGHWLDHSMEVSAAALRAFLAVDPKHVLVPKLVHWLSTVRQGNYWGSTKQTAMVVFAMTEYLAVSGDLEPDMTLTLTVNGLRIFGERITKANWAAFEGLRTFKGKDLQAGENEIVIEREGNGNPVWSIYARYYAEGEVKPSEGGIRVDRTYSRVVNDNGKRILQKLESGAEVTSGDEIEVMIAVTADRDYEWLMLDCPMPSGFEAVREYWGRPGWGRWAYWYSSKEFRDEKVSMAMTSLGAGTRQATYVMRAEAPGEVRALPATVFNMYHPQIGGNSGEFRLTVKERE